MYEPLERQLVRDIFTPEVIGVPPDALMSDAVRIMRVRNISCLPVIDGDYPVGIITERSIVLSASVHGVDFLQAPISDIMSAPVVTITADMHVYDAYNLLDRHCVRHLIVVDSGGRALGVISQRDLIEPLGLEYFVEIRRLANIMVRQIRTIQPQSPLTQAIKTMADASISCLVVMESTKPVGIITERDIADALSNRREVETLTAGAIMSGPVVASSLQTSVHEAVRLMKSNHIRHLIVTDEHGLIVGLTTLSDIVSSLQARYIDILRCLIREKEERYRSIFENSALGIFQSTSNGDILVINPAMVQMLGFEPPTPEHPGELNQALASLRSQLHENNFGHGVLADSQPDKGALEMSLLRKDGHPIVASMKIRCIQEPPHPDCAPPSHEGEIRLEVFVEDITKRKKAEEELEHQRKRLEERTKELAAKNQELEAANKRLLELDRMKSGFLSLVSHELRTPLTSISGFAKLTRKNFTLLSEAPIASVSPFKGHFKKVERNLGVIMQESERLKMMINDVLDLSKIESEDMEWNDVPCFLPRIIENAVDSMSSLLEQHPDVSLNATISPEIPPLMIDPKRILQVIRNLLHNAIKFTRQGAVRLTARVEDQCVRVSVSDTGVGVKPADQALIFEKFQQSAQGDRLLNKPKGAGLGLAICRQIIRRYHGDIRVESAPEQGSKFTFELPLEYVKAPESPD